MYLPKNDAGDYDARASDAETAAHLVSDGDASAKPAFGIPPCAVVWTSATAYARGRSTPLWGSQPSSSRRVWPTRVGAPQSPDAAGRAADCAAPRPIPPITWILPFIGHMGITDSRGRLHDWSGAPISATDPKHMLFGAPARYLTLARPRDANARLAWDDAVARADAEFAHHMHVMGCGHDCHSHVARALNVMRYRGSACHNKVELAVAVFFAGRFVSVAAAVKTLLPSAIIVALVVFFDVR
ncbi:hypothetical protein M885DRAFT_453502 [Pelagophyceae sp. CCMP2097]|nr:hypothetical protein M885DRAFT_453502 [Pelagophyceae sp. CCMP2097]